MSPDTSMYRCDVEVDLDLLERAFASLMARLREGGKSTFALDRDFYWAVDPEELLDAGNAPQKLGLGRVTDELEWLAGMAADSGESAIPHHLVWLGAALTAIGHRVKNEHWWPEDDTE